MSQANKLDDIYRQARWHEPIIFLKSTKEQVGHNVPEPDKEIIKEIGDIKSKIPKALIRSTPPELPEVAEIEVVRHYTRLSEMNYGVDSGFYPLGSCTMKYNPKINELVSSLDKVTDLHPLQNEDDCQGSLQIMYELQQWLAEISGMDKITLQPSAGAHGELVGVLIIRKYHELRGEAEQRTEMIVPDSAHGTNPASSAMAGFHTIELPSTEEGLVDIEALKAAVSEKTAGIMLTNPNTLGLFEKDIEEIAKIIHDAGGLLYYDGANLNAIMGKARPGDMGFDIVHMNLHKTFSTPHGGGGPGAGAVGVKKHLADFLPKPIVDFDGKKYFLKYDIPHSIGRVKSFHGNFGVLIRAYAYILAMGPEGLKNASETSVLNANYLGRKIAEIKGFALSHSQTLPRKHEAIITAEPLLKETGISALNVAKRLLDFGIHAPTIYFPLIVPEALMIEPTETESKENLDLMIDAMKKISEEAYTNPEILKTAPHNTAVGPIDEVKAAHPKTMALTWRMYMKKHN